MPGSESDGPFERGHVVWHDGLFRGSGRPWLVLSDDAHPFHGQEYVVTGLTTTPRDDAIAITDDDWLVGGLPGRSHVSPWFLTTLKHDAIDRGVGMLSTTTVETIGTAVDGYLP